MAFIRLKDYYKQVATPTFNQVLQQTRNISGDPEILAAIESTAIEDSQMYLRQRYDLDRLYAPFIDFDITTVYTWGDRIDFAGVDFSVSTVYASGALVNYNGFVYEKNANVSGYTAGALPINTLYFDNRGSELPYYIALPVEFNYDKTYSPNDYVTFEREVYQKTDHLDGYYPGLAPKQPSIVVNASSISIIDQSNTSTQTTNDYYWKKIATIDYSTNYSVSGIWPNDNTGKWTQGDNRNLPLIKRIVDMVLYDMYGMINPNQVPKLRFDRNKDAVDWLKAVAEGLMTLDAPDLTANDQEGFSIRFGSNPPTTHSY